MEFAHFKSPTARGKFPLGTIYAFSRTLQQSAKSWAELLQNFVCVLYELALTGELRYTEVNSEEHFHENGRAFYGNGRKRNGRHHEGT